MSSVCVGCLLSTGGSARCFFPPARSLVVLTRMALSYLTSELCAGIMVGKRRGGETAAQCTTASPANKFHYFSF